MAQRIGDVLAHRHVRPHRIGLEHHADVAQARRHQHAARRRRHHLAADADRARRSECSRPATQRSVVVLPQPEGPSSTTISPAATWKLTSSTAGRPMLNSLRRSRTLERRRHARPFAMTARATSDRSVPSLAIAVGLVPLLDPRRAQLLVLLEVRHPRLHLVRIVALRLAPAGSSARSDCPAP